MGALAHRFTRQGFSASSFAANIFSGAIQTQQSRRGGYGGSVRGGSAFLRWHPLGNTGPTNKRYVWPTVGACDGWHKMTLLLSEVQTAKPPGVNRSGFAFVPQPCRPSTAGIGWSSKTAMKRLTSLAHSRSLVQGWGCPFRPPKYSAGAKASLGPDQLMDIGTASFSILRIVFQLIPQRRASSSRL
jgi:hypothetical protein